VTPDRKPIPVNPPLDLSAKPQKVAEAAPAATPEVAPEVTPEVKPPAAPVLRNTVIQYTIESCSWCKYDQKQVFPRWAAKGWKILDPVDETATAKGVYPRYDIYDADGNKKTHKGSLISYKP
jgi:hypothetical protein